MKRKKSISIIDFFYFYPFKKNFYKTPNTIPQPFIKAKDEVLDHQFTMEYPDWREVIDSYIEHIQEELLKGREFTLPSGLGFLQLRKYKTKRKIDYAAWLKTGEKKYYKTNDNYTVLLKWYRKYGRKRLAFQNHWLVGITAIMGKKIHKMITTNPDTVYNILDT